MTPASDRALVQVPPGRLQLDLSIKSADGAVLDTGAQDIDVPIARGAGPVLLQPQVVRARTVREFRTLSASPDAAPTPSRVFSRSERLLIRVPAYNPDGARGDHGGLGLEHQGRDHPESRTGAVRRRRRRNSICRWPSWRRASTVSKSASRAPPAPRAN